MTTTYTLSPAGSSVTFDAAFELRVAAGSARFDATYSVPAGTYPLYPRTIGGLDATIADAYYFDAALPGTLTAGGYPDEKVGVTTRTVGFTAYGYRVRATVDAAA